MSFLEKVKKKIIPKEIEKSGKEAEEVEKDVKEVKGTKATGRMSADGRSHKRRTHASYYDIVRYPYVTEKSSALQAQHNTYTFAVASDANKAEIAKAMRHLFGVHPVRVNISKKPSRTVFLSGHRGKTSIVKKAIVTLPEGEKIDIGTA